MTHTHTIVEERNGLPKWLRIDLVGFVIQTLVLVGGIIYGYTKLESKVDETNRTVVDHITKHGAYLQKESWEIRNRFVDEKLDKIDNKQDRIEGKQDKILELLVRKQK